MFTLDREVILSALRQALEPLDYVYAMWEGGAAAFGRVDAWSDIDLCVDAADERAAEVLAVCERTLAALSPLTLKYEMPQPTWHGHWQSFFQLEAAGPFQVVDLAVIRHSNPQKFLEPEIHGRARVHFDKARVVAGAPALEAAALTERLAGRRAALRVTFPLFQALTIKELRRGNLIEAVGFYHAFSLRPLVEALRISHCPARYNFHTRYVYYDLPAEVVRRLEPLFLPGDAADLERKRAEAETWFGELLG